MSPHACPSPLCEIRTPTCSPIRRSGAIVARTASLRRYGVGWAAYPQCAPRTRGKSTHPYPSRLWPPMESSPSPRSVVKWAKVDLGYG